MKEKGFLSPYSLFATIVTSVIGLRVFSYASDVSMFVGNDGWIVILISTIISFILVYIMYKIVKNSDYKCFSDIINNNFGKAFGAIIGISFIVYNIAYMSIGLRTFIEEIKIYLLEKTPTEFLVAISILTSIYLIRGNLNSLVKFNEVVFWLSFIPVIFVLLFTLYKSDFSNLLPVFNNPPDSYIKGTIGTISRFKGIEIVFLVLPFIKNRKKTPKVLLKSLAFIGCFYIFITVLSITMFSKEQTKDLIWPGITMIKSIDIPGTFVERWDGIVMAIWVLFFFTTFTNSYYFSADIAKDIFKLKDIKIASAILVPFIYIVALYPENVAEVSRISKMIFPILFMINTIIIPIVLLITSNIKKSRTGTKG